MNVKTPSGSCDVEKWDGEICTEYFMAHVAQRA